MIDLDAIQRILSLYEQASRQKLNREKTSVFFSRPTPSCFKLPSRLLNDIEMMTRKFWWGQRGDQRRIHWKKWETFCKPKALGGMGFKDLENFNEAMLAKQVWRLLVDRSSLFYRVFSVKYFPSRSIFDAKVAFGSYAWQSIVKARNLVQTGLLWRVGNGKKINVYGDRWLPGEDSACILSPKNGVASNWEVAKLLATRGEGWNDELVEALFLRFEAQRIKSIPIHVTDQKDNVTWPRCRLGAYSVKMGYQMLCETEMKAAPSSSNADEVKRFWKRIWRLKVPNKVKVLLW